MSTNYTNTQAGCNTAHNPLAALEASQTHTNRFCIQSQSQAVDIQPTSNSNSNTFGVQDSDNTNDDFDSYHHTFNNNTQRAPVSVVYTGASRARIPTGVPQQHRSTQPANFISRIPSGPASPVPRPSAPRPASSRVPKPELNPKPASPSPFPRAPQQQQQAPADISDK